MCIMVPVSISLSSIAKFAPLIFIPLEVLWLLAAMMEMPAYCQLQTCKRQVSLAAGVSVQLLGTLQEPKLLQLAELKGFT